MNKISSKAKPWVISAALLGATAVLLGAFGAHGLKAVLSVEHLVTWKTASSYQLVHAVLLLAISFSVWIDLRSIRLACAVLFVGVLLFSGSLYVVLLSGFSNIAFITPVGGVLILAGWLLLAVAALRSKEYSSD